MLSAIYLTVNRIRALYSVRHVQITKNNIRPFFPFYAAAAFYQKNNAQEKI